MQCCSLVLVTCAIDGNVYEGLVFIVFTLSHSVESALCRGPRPGPRFNIYRMKSPDEHADELSALEIRKEEIIVRVHVVLKKS